MPIMEWIIIAVMAGGLGISTLAARYGWGVRDVNTVSRSSRAGSHSSRGRYYRGGKH